MAMTARNGGRSAARAVGRWRTGTLLVLALYLLQFGAAVFHGAEWPEPTGSSPVVHAADAASHAVAPHDPATCPVCVAMCGVAIIAHAPASDRGIIETSLASSVPAALRDAPAPAPSSRGPPVTHA